MAKKETQKQIDERVKAHLDNNRNTAIFFGIVVIGLFVLYAIANHQNTIAVLEAVN